MARRWCVVMSGWGSLWWPRQVGRRRHPWARPCARCGLGAGPARTRPVGGHHDGDRRRAGGDGDRRRPDGAQAGLRRRPLRRACRDARRRSAPHQRDVRRPQSRIRGRSGRESARRSRQRVRGQGPTGARMAGAIRCRPAVPPDQRGAGAAGGDVARGIEPAGHRSAAVRTARRSRRVAAPQPVDHGEVRAPVPQSAGAGTRPSCWDIYQRLVVAAANALESCLASFAVYNPLRQACAFVWTLQVESAWFQFLSCSSFPMK